LNDELTQKLSAVREKTATVAGAPSDLINETVNPNVTNFYEPYKLQTPSKWTGSFAYVFGKKGLISVDYSMKDYGSTQFKPENDIYFKLVNADMNNLLACTNEWRIGGEYKIKAWSLRAGYRFEQSPYKNKVTIGDLTGYSAGLGYNFGGTKLDLAYSTSQRNTKQGFFDKGFTDGALINTRNNVFTLTVLFEL
jgi:long-subunit fatty acid transport protein